jgi:plastocyanin
VASGVIDLSISPREQLSRGRLTLRIIVAIGALTAAAALAMLPAPAGAAMQSVLIKMGDTPAVYEPAKVTVKVGQPVEWINTGKNVHSVTLVPDDAQNSEDVAEPKGRHLRFGFHCSRQQVQLHVHGPRHLSLLLRSP